MIVWFRASFVLVALSAIAPASAFALPERESEPATPLEQAREESSVRVHPRERHALPAGTLRLSASELLASSGQRLELSVTLDRDVAAGTLEVTLPRLWVSRSGVSDLPYARVPTTGRAAGPRAGARRGDRVVTFAFDGGRAGDVARFQLTDVGIPAGTYHLPYRWQESGAAAETGTATVIFYAPTREEQKTVGGDWARLANPGFEQNATDDASTESETFLTVVPGNRKRFIVGANGGGGYNAWVTNNGGQSFTKAEMPATTDVPGAAGPETLDLCCDPMSAADAAGNLWYGGLSRNHPAPQPSRIVINRIAPGETSFQPFTVGLTHRTAGTQDKPMMTIDNSPSSPRFGRLYVIWDEPSSGGVNVVMSQCDTRPGGVLNAANCDNADNWSPPVSVTPATGSYIYADVATAPDGTVHVVWWDYSAANAIRGDSCGAAANCAAVAGWGTPQTIATLDATNGTPIPFACPIVAQPGGRAAPSPQLDVDHSGGANSGRVYVTWSDLRSDSGTTKCGDATPPVATHLSWDSFVASAAGTLPGPGASSSVGTRLLTDGEGGGEASSDDWFPWLAVDQTTGQAWADFYSTRDDALRRTTNFYARSVTPTVSGHTLGSLTRVSGAASDYSTSTCCLFGNDYGDYTGLDATQGIAFPVWSDKRSADGEAYTFVRIEAGLVADSQAVDDSAGDNDGVLEPGEPFALSQALRNEGSAAATSVSAAVTESLPELSFSQAASAYPDIAIGTSEQNTSAFAGTLEADAACGRPLPISLQVSTADGPFTIPLDVPTGAPAPVQTFSATPATVIPDNNVAGVSDELEMSGVTGLLSDLDVRVDISHSFDGDLSMALRAPDGTTIPLVQNRGGSGDDFTDTDLDDEAATAISDGAAPFTGSFRPEQPLSNFDGMDPNGTWTLLVVDSVSGDTGTLKSWRLSASGSECSAPPDPPSLSGTDPASPASDTTPRVLGTAPAGSTVSVYTGTSCSGTPAATGSASELASPGIEVSVPSGSTSNIYARATADGLTSVCSAPVSYVHQTGTPGGGTPGGGTPGGGTPTPDTSVTLDLGAAAAQRALRTGGLRIAVSCGSEACRVSASGRVTVPSPKRGGRAKRIATRPASRNLGAGERATLKLALSPSLRTQMARALRSRRTRGGVRATLTATAVDAAGNKQTKSTLVRVRP